MAVYNIYIFFGRRPLWKSSDTCLLTPYSSGCLESTSDLVSKCAPMLTAFERDHQLFGRKKFGHCTVQEYLHPLQWPCENVRCDVIFPIVFEADLLDGDALVHSWHTGNKNDSISIRISIRISISIICSSAHLLICSYAHLLQHQHQHHLHQHQLISISIIWISISSYA